MRRIFILLVLLTLVAACRSMPLAGECPDSVGMKCMAGKQCAEDKRRGCIMCRCDSPNLPSDTEARDAQERGRSPDFPQ